MDLASLPSDGIPAVLAWAGTITPVHLEYGRTNTVTVRRNDLWGAYGEAFR